MCWRSFQDEPVLWDPDDPKGMVHEVTCTWLNGAGQDPDYRAQYVEIRRGNVPAERWENLCRHCGASRW